MEKLVMADCATMLDAINSMLKNRNDTRDTRYGLTQEERETIGYIDFNNNGEEPDDDE